MSASPKMESGRYPACCAIWKNSYPEINKATAITAKKTSPPTYTDPRIRGIRTMALARRYLSTTESQRGLDVLQFSKSAVPLTECDQCVVQFLFAKIGPEGGCGVVFRVGSLPDQKVRQAHFASGTDDQIGVGQASG